MAGSPAERSLALAEGHLEAAQYMEEAHRFDDARRQLALALRLIVEAGDTNSERDTWIKIAQVARRQGQLADAVDAFSQAIALARVPGLEHELAVALGHLGVVEAQRGQPREAALAWHECLALADLKGWTQMVAPIATNLGRLELERGDIAEAERAFLRALAVADEADDNAERGAAYNALGEIARIRGELVEARRLLDLALKFTQQTSDVGALAATYANLGNIARSAGNIAQAERFFTTDMRFCVAVGDTVGMARAHANLGNVAAALGQIAKAREHYEAGLVLDRKFGLAKSVLGGHVNLASLLVVEGRFAEARAHYDSAIAQLRPMRSPRTLSDVLMLRGQLEARMGELAAAAKTFGEAHEQALVAQHRVGRARIALCIAALDHARGDVARALVGYRDTVTDLEAEGVVSDIVMAYLAYAECAIAAGDDALADALAAKARAAIDQGAGPTRGKAKAVRGQPFGPSRTVAREHLDLESLAVRASLGRHALLARPGAMATLAALHEAERTTDALTLALVIADAAEAPDDDRRLAEGVVAQAAALGLEPLVLDAESIVASYTNDLATLERAHERAHALQLGLLVARIRRRMIAVLAPIDETKAQTLRDEALSWARGNGVMSEVTRLERSV